MCRCAGVRSASRPGRHAPVNGLQRAKKRIRACVESTHSRAGHRTCPVALGLCCARVHSGARGSDPAEKRCFAVCAVGQPPRFSGSRSRELTESGALRTAATLWTDGPAGGAALRPPTGSGCVYVLPAGAAWSVSRLWTKRSLPAHAERKETKKESLPSPMFPRGARQLWTSPSRRLAESTSPVIRWAKRLHHMPALVGGTGPKVARVGISRTGTDPAPITKNACHPPTRERKSEKGSARKPFEKGGRK